MLPGYHVARMGDRKGRSKWGGEKERGEQAPAEQQEGERRKRKRKSVGQREDS